jgi:hypothetical protein
VHLFQCVYLPNATCPVTNHSSLLYVGNRDIGHLWRGYSCIQLTSHLATGNTCGFFTDFCLEPTFGLSTMTSVLCSTICLNACVFQVCGYVFKELCGAASRILAIPYKLDQISSPLLLSSASLGHITTSYTRSYTLTPRSYILHLFTSQVCSIASHVFDFKRAS